MVPDDAESRPAPDGTETARSWTAADEDGCDYRAGFTEDGRVWLSDDLFELLKREFIHAVVSPRKKSPESRCKDPTCVHCVIPPRKPREPHPWDAPWSPEELRSWWRLRYPTDASAREALRAAIKDLRRGAFVGAHVRYRAALAVAWEFERAGRPWAADILVSQARLYLRWVKKEEARRSAPPPEGVARAFPERDIAYLLNPRDPYYLCRGCRRPLMIHGPHLVCLPPAGTRLPWLD